MKRFTDPRAWAGLACLLAFGCSVARELPRTEYAARSERRHVKVETRSGTEYDFDRVQIAADSLHGRSAVDSEGPFEQYQSVSLPLDQVVKISVRRVDWYRTGLIAGVAAAVALAAVLSQEGSGSGGDVVPGPCSPRPCP